MNTMVISENSFQAGPAGRPKALGGPASLGLVKAFGDRIYTIAKRITQNDDAAEDILIGTFLEVCSDLDGADRDEKVWLQLVAIAVRGAFSKLRAEGRLLLDRGADSYEELMVHEFFVWGDTGQHRCSQEPATHVLEHGLRSLDPMARTVFVLRDIEEIAVGHIAQIVHRSVAAVEVCLLRARLQLRETLARQMHQTGAAPRRVR